MRSVPGPFLAKTTAQWLILVDLAGNRTSTIHHLHKKYGPSVRIAPNEVSYSNVEVVKELYSQQTQFMKAPSYEAFVVPPIGIFSMRDKVAHSQRRRLLSHAFSQSNLLDTQPIIKQIISKLVTHVEGRLGTPADMLLWFRLTAFDIVGMVYPRHHWVKLELTTAAGELFLGESSGGLDTLMMPALLVDTDRFFIIGSIGGAYPWLLRLVQFLPIPSLQHLLAAEQRVVQVCVYVSLLMMLQVIVIDPQYGRNAFNTYISRYGRDSGRRDLLTKIVNNKTTLEAPMSDLETYIEISNLVFAGTGRKSTPRICTGVQC